MTKQQKKNLRSLFKIKRSKAKFCMAYFFCRENRIPNRRFAATKDMYDCKTSACFAGHLPFTTGIKKEHGEGWYEYIYRLTGLIPHKKVNEARGFHFLFSEIWEDDIDNSIKRLRAFIKNGYKAPSCFDKILKDDGDIVWFSTDDLEDIPEYERGNYRTSVDDHTLRYVGA